MLFIDTNIAIAMRDVDRATIERVRAFAMMPSISIMTRIELEDGVNRNPAVAVQRRARLDRFLQDVEVEYFSREDILVYGRIVNRLGHDRRLTLDRLIAAQAISRNATLVTRNGKDFRKIEGLRLEEWETPDM